MQSYKYGVCADVLRYSEFHTMELTTAINFQLLVQKALYLPDLLLFFFPPPLLGFFIALAGGFVYETSATPKQLLTISK